MSGYAHVRNGSNPEVRECDREVGFPPKSGHCCERPLRANSSPSSIECYGMLIYHMPKAATCETEQTTRPD